MKISASTTAIACVAAGLLCAASAVAVAQGRGGGAGSGQHGTQGRPTSAEPRGSGAGSGAEQPGTMGRGDRDRDRIHLTDEQRDRLKDCSGSADRIHQGARKLVKEVSGGGLRSAEVRQQRDRLADQVGVMLQQHDRLMVSLSDADRKRLGDRTERLTRQRDRLETCLGNLDHLLHQQRLDGKALSREARELRKAARQWQREHQRLSGDLGAG